MIMFWQRLTNDVEYSTSFRVQRIHFCDSESVQYRAEWFDCRWALYGALNDTSVH